jgi:hypothetical protein
MPDYPNPLDQGHCDCLDRIIQRTTMAMQLADDCKSCGFDVDQYIDVFKQQLDSAKKAKAKFFPQNL